MFNPDEKGPVDLNALLAGEAEGGEKHPAAEDDAENEGADLQSDTPAEGEEGNAAADDEQPGSADANADAEPTPAADAKEPAQQPMPDIATMIREAVKGVVQELGLVPAAANEPEPEEDDEEELTPDQRTAANAAFLDKWTEDPLAALGSILGGEIERAFGKLNKDVTSQIQPIQQQLTVAARQREFDSAVADLRATNPDFQTLVPAMAEVIKANPFLAEQGKAGLIMAMQLARSQKGTQAKAADAKRAAGLGTGGRPAQGTQKLTSEQLIQRAIAGGGHRNRF